ncbi:MAG: hypothetical protein QM570_15500 [Planctomycetota bacterium]|jgi:hypothetical protein|nr:hypothetical protein [Planctomycetota bacterium]
MAITVTAITTTAPLSATLGAVPWQVNAATDDASGCETIKAAPGATSKLVVTRLWIYIGGAVTVTIGAGKSSSAVEAVLFGPVGGAAGTYWLDCRERPIELPANKALTVDASDTAYLCVYVEGYTKTA